MEISEREKREVLASELADIFHRQEAIVACNDLLDQDRWDTLGGWFRQIAAEDEKVLEILESVINDFGLRVSPRESAIATCDFILEQIQDESTQSLERLNVYNLLRHNQMLSCYLVYKVAQLADEDIKMALRPFEFANSLVSRQAKEFHSCLEEFGVMWMTGEKPQSRILDRAKDFYWNVTHAMPTRAHSSHAEKSILTLLANDHRKIEALFQEILTAATFNEARDIFSQLKADLTAHTIAEEECVYGHFVKLPTLRAKVVHSQREHEILRNLMDEVGYASHREGMFYERVENLKEHVEQHIRVEESDIFRLVRKAATETQLRGLSHKFLEAKKTIQIKSGVGPAIASMLNLPNPSHPSQGRE